MSNEETITLEGLSEVETKTADAISFIDDLLVTDFEVTAPDDNLRQTVMNILAEAGVIGLDGENYVKDASSDGTNKGLDMILAALSELEGENPIVAAMQTAIEQIQDVHEQALNGEGKEGLRGIIPEHKALSKDMKDKLLVFRQNGSEGIHLSA